MKRAIEGRPGLVDCRREPGEPIPEYVKATLEELAKMPDDEIDTSDIPEWTEEMSKNAVRGRLPVKQAVSLRLDADVLAWLKKNGQGYQTRVNRILGTGC